MSDRPKFARSVALEAARELCWVLKEVCVCGRIICAGSLRREKEQVGDVELLYIPEFATERAGLFDTERVNLVDRKLADLLAAGVLGKRRNVNGAETWGTKNKLAFHCASGVPVDLFEATQANWFNYLVCRTGGARSNVEVASAAQRKGWKWNPYGPGFTDQHGAIVPVTCERDVFDLMGLPYREPRDRA